MTTAAVDPPVGPIPLAPGEPARVLVVDDEPRLRQILVRLMARDGFECLEAGNGADALEVLARVPVPLVLSDVSMPGMDGLAFLQEARARWPDLAVVMVTAVADVSVAVTCLSYGAMDYLTKPFHLAEVRARVRQALEKRRLAVENRMYQRDLEARVAEQARRLEALFLTSMQSLADVLEVKDPYTHGHSERVSGIAVAIGRAMGLDAGHLDALAIGGHLHDLGKIGVREEVLGKPGPLTEAEYQHVMEHPMIGWRILGPLLAEQPCALRVVRSHHERWDGLGVPDGLTGPAIPLEARIAAVADSLDAMTSHRPYRRGRTLDAALVELRRCVGTQFDPDVVAALEVAVGRGEVRVG